MGLKKQIQKKDIEEFVDSSEEDAIVLKDPYPRLPFIEPTEVSPLTKKRLENIRAKKGILDKGPIAHQSLLKKPAIAIKYKKSEFPAPLAPVNKINAVPSMPINQCSHNNSIVPAFRGIKYNNDLSPSDLFYVTRADWLDTHHFASMTFKIAKIDIVNYTESFLEDSEEFLKKYKHYDLSYLNKDGSDFETNNKALKKAAQKLKVFFECADKISNSLGQWQKIFPTMRKSHDEKIVQKKFTLAQILSYIYVNGYDSFKEIMHNFKSILKKISNNELTTSFNALKIPSKEQGNGMYHLSEGQIPRHALLYAFGLKNYTKGKAQQANPLYTEELKPETHNVYLGKIMVTCNPNTLFASKDKAIFVPDFDAKYGNKIISKTILPEKEIQHRAANLKGTIKSSVNIKLPKFHHKKAPKRYLAKYGLNENYYSDFKKTFAFLAQQKEFGKLSWMYLETILLAHLIQFHEMQLYASCNLLAYEANKDILWVNRKSQKIEDPFPMEFDSSLEI